MNDRGGLSVYDVEFAYSNGKIDLIEVNNRFSELWYWYKNRNNSMVCNLNNISCLCIGESIASLVTPMKLRKMKEFLPCIMYLYVYSSNNSSDVILGEGEGKKYDGDYLILNDKMSKYREYMEDKKQKQNNNSNACHCFIPFLKDFHLFGDIRKVASVLVVRDSAEECWKERDLLLNFLGDKYF